MLDQIINRHNPEIDVNPYGPLVTWAEAELAEEVLKQQEQIKILEDKVDLMVEIILRSIKQEQNNGEETQTNGNKEETDHRQPAGHQPG